VALRTLLDDEEEEEATLAEAQAAGVRDTLLRCAALHPTHAGVQAACCWALAEYVHTAQRTEVASYPSVFQAVVAALKAHPLDEVQKAALAVLRNVCCFGLEGTPGVPALLDAIPLALAALRAFPSDLIVQEYGCDSLARMCGMDASVAEAVAAAGAVGLFLKALNLDITDDITCVAAVKAIGAIALASAALPQASAGIEAVVRVLRRHKKSSSVAISACRTLGVYLRFPGTRERAVQAGAKAAIREARAKHNKDEKVKKAAQDALKAPHA